ncbi:hypothetical protein GGF46_001298 [Coemansia sp. RSA 552]|nr:hypothetical protein GGF46_001298 [Coemansia sp. RSA 552]
MARCRSHRAMASSPSPLTTSVLDIQAADHIHPVRISADVPRSTDGPMHSKAPAGSSELESVARHIPLVKLRPSSSAVWSQIQAPVAYSVHDLFTKADDLTDKIISVRGVIFQREVERIASFTGAARAQEASDRGGLSVSQVKNRITLQDSDGGSRTVAVYMSLSSYFQPLQLVQGTAVVFRGVTASVAKGSGNPYLTWTAASSVEEVSGEPGPRQCTPAGMDSGAVERPDRAYIGQLYTSPGLWNRMVTLLCYVSSVKSFRLKMMCCACRQAVRSMRCACAKKMHRMVGNEDVRRGGRPATVEADVDLVAVASDGSGLGLLVVSSGPELAALLGLSHDSLDELYCSAAQSLSGQLLWKPQQRSEEPAATSLIDGAAAAIANRAVLVEVVVSQREAPAAKQQALRLDGEDATVARRPEPLMAVARVTCPAATELSWQLLNELGA